MQKQNIFLGFTLVELIVVITIVGILSTVGFVSYSGYLTGARDSNRISQMVRLSDSLQVYGASKTLPLPDNNIQITASGTLIGYQGEVGIDVLETIDYTNGGTDPKDGDYYTYYLTRDRNSLQLMALMEESRSVGIISPRITSTTNANFEDRFPKVYGRKLGVLTYNDESDTTLTNTPANLISTNAVGLDIVSTPTAYIAHIADDEKLEGTGSTLMASSPEASCKRIKQTGGARDNGIYTILPAGTDFEVYCDMEIAGGGWTLIARSYSGATATNFGWLHNFGSITDDNEAYSMGANSQLLGFESIIVSGYTNGKDILGPAFIEVNDTDLKISSNNPIAVDSCKGTCSELQYWGRFSRASSYYFTDDGADDDHGLRPNGFPGVQIIQGMIFVK